MATLKQKIILAKRCGWSYQEKRDAAKAQHKPVGVYRPDGRIAAIQYYDGECFSIRWARAFSEGIIPDYFKDLNAMHEVEKTLTATERITYVTKLVSIVNANWMDVLSATAEQRAKAFFYMIGKQKTKK